MSDLDSKQLSKHATVDRLQSLFSSAIVCGGSFSPWLPDPAGIDSEQRRAVLNQAKPIAVEACLSALLTAVGITAGARISRAATGERVWPDGYTGSLTHKGTVVLGAISSKAMNSGIGIDLERDDGKSLSEIRGLVGLNEIPAGSTVTPLILFSAKEAIFKAQFSVTRARIEFDDVRISWKSANEVFFGVAKLAGGICVEVRVSCLDKWVVSGARVI